MSSNHPIRWGVLGTAHITRRAFIPALKAAGQGVIHAVAGRDAARTAHFARAEGIEHALTGYETLLADSEVEVVYIPLPNSLHAEWSGKALRAGKAVFCEKPLCVTAQETEDLLHIATQTGLPLWEAFVFPFHQQMRRLLEIVSSGTIGDLVEVQSNFHFKLDDARDIRLQANLGGGALYDVGCYPIAFARFLFGPEVEDGSGWGHWTEDGVDDESYGTLVFGERRMLFSCGMRGPDDTWARVLGRQGEIRLTNPFHPGPDDTIEVRTEAGVQTEGSGQDEPTFTPALRHIHAVLRGAETPEHLAIDEALGSARAIDLLLTDMRSRA